MLNAGTRIGTYEIVGPLGAGGMGEVYRARDTRLHREVALKVLPESFALDPERLARFKREAQVLAALNHPHIAAIHGLEETEGMHALVLELVEGPTLADRIAAGAIPLPEALPIARQIADALEAAHELGIIHRDLKPSNIKITPDGAVKVLDFGLAKSAPSDGGHHLSDVTVSPTIASPAMMTGIGTILGTAAYMAPEQAKGRTADKRSDVWAFGCVLYEMLTGKRAFDGEDISDTMAAVLRGEPDWTALPRDTPRTIQRLLRLCLQKDRKQRAPDIAIARFDIDDTLRTPDADVERVEGRRPQWRTVVVAAALGAVACAATGAAVWISSRPEPPRVTRFDIAPSVTAAFTVSPNGVNLAVSPDGSQIAYHVRRGAGALDLRRFDQLDSQPIAGTEGATHPAFSPDGRTLVFVKDRKLQKLALDGRTSVALCDVSNGAGTTWLTSDAILFAQANAEGGLFRVSAAGGPPDRVAAPDASKGEQEYSWPESLPDGRTVLFMIRRAEGAQPQIAVRSLESGEQNILIEGGSYPRYVSTGHLLYVQSGTLLAIPFDAATRAVTGSAVPVQEGIVSKGNGVANYGVSRDGTFVYVPGGAVAYVSRFVWKDRTGRLLRAATGELEYPRYPRISPDSRRLAATLGPSNEGSIWVYDLANTGQPLKLTFKAHNLYPTWTTDGTHLAFLSNQAGSQSNLYMMPADGSRLEAERFLMSDNVQSQPAWSPDGQWLIFQEGSAGSGPNLWVVRATGDRKPQLWLETMFAETSPNFSPDGRWVAYVTDQTGEAEVWVRPFPGPGSPTRVSPGGGRDPVWSRDGKELFYQEGNKLMAAEVAGIQPALQFTTPRVLFEGGFIPWEPNTPRTYDVAADGRFLMIEQTPSYLTQRFAVVLNWFEELKRRVPVN
jgi:serine/threonine-protein kinase